MTWWHAIIIMIAGIWAGTINAVVGSGTLVTFPVLVALGYPPVTATTSNAIGLAPGTVSGAYGYRHELKGYWPQVVRFSVASFLGAIGGTILLLSLPKDAFETTMAMNAIEPLLDEALARLRSKDRCAVTLRASPATPTPTTRRPPAPSGARPSCR